MGKQKTPPRPESLLSTLGSASSKPQVIVPISQVKREAMGTLGMQRFRV